MQYSCFEILEKSLVRCVIDGRWYHFSWNTQSKGHAAYVESVRACVIDSNGMAQLRARCKLRGIRCEAGTPREFSAAFTNGFVLVLETPNKKYLYKIEAAEGRERVNAVSANLLARMSASRADLFARFHEAGMRLVRVGRAASSAKFINKTINQK